VEEDWKHSLAVFCIKEKKIITKNINPNLSLDMLLKNVVDDFILNRDKELTLNIMACSYFDAF